MTYNGVRMYSVGRFKQYIEWWKKHVYVLADIYIRDVSQYVECLETVSYTHLTLPTNREV